MLQRVKRPELQLALVCVAAVLALLQMAAMPGDPSRRPGGRTWAPVLTVGQKAPDVELPRLALEKTEDGGVLGRVSSEKVKLSAVWAKKPVCLFMSSYT
ncbi:MAG TPA: hypothetical protein VM238_17840 [Phycisphaerae bacterium]|nr:hypothetical protein [Phycisphaerae bacterium]